MDQQAKKRDKTERIIGLGRRTREEIVKWNQMTALRYQTGGRHPTSLVSLWGERARERIPRIFQLSKTKTIQEPNLLFQGLCILSPF